MIEQELQELQEDLNYEKIFRLKYFNETFLDKDYSFLVKWKVIGIMGYCQCFANCGNFNGGEIHQTFVNFIISKDPKISHLTLKNLDWIKEPEYNNEPRYKKKSITKINKQEWNECKKILDLTRKYIQEYIKNQMYEALDNLETEKDLPKCLFCHSILFHKDQLFCSNCGKNIKEDIK